MNIRPLRLLALLFCLSCTPLLAQDIHFTQFYMMPTNLNPANIGRFEGTVRIGGIYRSQWRSVLGRGSYETPGIYADAPIIRGFRKKDWIGVGLMMIRDRAGVTNDPDSEVLSGGAPPFETAGFLTRTASRIGASYHLALDKKGNTVLTLGAQYGAVNKTGDWDNFTFEDGYLKNPKKYLRGNSKDYIANQGGQKKTHTGIDAGVVLTSRLNKRMDFNIGFAMGNVNTPRASLLADSVGGNFEMPRKSIAHGQFNIQMTEKFTFSPQFMFGNIGGHDEIQVQAMGALLFNEEKDITLTFGLGYRLRDAVSPIVGFRKKALTVGLAYDLNVSPLNAQTNYRGGFELAANYIIKIYKPAKIKPKILCPRF